MPMRANVALSLAAVPALCSLLVAPAAGSALLVEATGFADEAGEARVAVWSSRVSFPDEPRFTATQPIQGGRAAWEVPDLPTGDYAVLVWHDRDADGSFDRGMFGAPQEPYGYSNAVREGRPDWDQVRITLGPDPLPVPIALE